MSTPEIAERLARSAHAGQQDKSGHPYAEHPRRVAERAARIAPAALREDAVCAAWLHDVVEDTAVTLEDLRRAGFSAAVVDAVRRVTKRAGVAPEEYFAGIRGHRVARIVKTADLIDNTDPERVARLDAGTRERLAQKYSRSWELLLGPLGES